MVTSNIVYTVLCSQTAPFTLSIIHVFLLLHFSAYRQEFSRTSPSLKKASIPLPCLRHASIGTKELLPTEGRSIIVVSFRQRTHTPPPSSFKEIKDLFFEVSRIRIPRVLSVIAMEPSLHTTAHCSQFNPAALAASRKV